jgi:hypothetical protein
MKTGTIVGCRHRWPNKHLHPDDWTPPWKGEVLAVNDVRAWKDTMSFSKILHPQGPSQEQVNEKIQKITKHGKLDGVPILYTRDNGSQFISWERTSSLAPYADELAEWNRQREEARQRRAVIVESKYGNS